MTSRPREGRPATSRGPRMRIVGDLLATGWSAPKIYRRLAEDFAESGKLSQPFTSVGGKLLSYNQLLEIYREVEDEFAEHFARDRGQWANQLKAMILDLYERAVADKQLSAAGQCLDRLAKLEGLYTERVELSGPGGGPIQIDAAERDLTVLTDEELAEYERLNAKIFARSRERTAAQQFPNFVGDAKVLAAGPGGDVGGDPGGEG